MVEDVVSAGGGTRPVRAEARIAGIVQGVGFRPFVHRLATERGLAGAVGNDARGVWLAVEGPPADVEGFLTALREQAPPLARIDDVEVVHGRATGVDGFEIVTSTASTRRDVLVSPDVATCDDCRAEVADPSDRRYRYPFTNCTNCGPRYSIVRDVPYDRPATTMADFPLCAACRAEYTDPTDRRFHAQPVCCPACGPQLRLDVDGGTVATRDDALRQGAARLRSGEVLAVKGIGGWHLAALASDDAAVARLRSRKQREEKPFAVMVGDLAAARRLCHVDEAAAALLRDRARPIVLVPRRQHADLADAVAPGDRSVGLMLPYTPLHDLLLRAVGAPVVLTSGNVSDEPIAHEDDDAARRLAPIADAMLGHDRPIHVRVDDSVVRPMRDRTVPVRRSRGLAPGPVRLPVAAPVDVLAVGAELKNTVCLARGERAFVSQHVGDLENYPTFRSFLAAIEHLGRLFDVRPRVVAHDLHPEYLSTKHALELAGVDLLGVQHHHAHIASCMADNEVTAPVLGIAFDGTGYGTDGTIWGGELLVADLEGFQRVGHLATVPMPGGAAAIRQPWRMAASHLDAAGLATVDLAVARRQGGRWDQVLAVGRAGVNAPTTSSAGRLFDAVAALLGVRDEITYEGQAAIGLEQLADPAEDGAYELGAEDVGGMLRLQVAGLVRAVVDELTAGEPVATIAARFHNGVAHGVAEAAAALAVAHDLRTVALSGGVFQNVLLTTRLVALLEQRGLHVLVHRQVPPNDGGISLGQAAVAAATLAAVDTSR